MGEEMLAKDQSENIRPAERVKKLPNPNSPITIRMSPNLVKRLDRLAKAQHRTRANLVQYVLWEHVSAQEGIVAGPKPSQRKTAARAPARKKSTPRKRVVSA